jgi:hypothetical protein
MTQRHPMIATTLGLANFPGDEAVVSEASGHIMGVTLLAWLTQHPVRRWGDAWAARGTIRLRYREHLSAGTPLTTLVGGGAELDLQVVDGTGRVCADGTAGLADAVGKELRLDPLPPAAAAPVPPFQAAVGCLVLRPLEFDFLADRDLTFVEELPDGEWWQRRGWAHPAWVASGANAVLANSIAFSDGGYWKHAGSETQHLQPIASGARIRIDGRIERIFEGAHHRFAVAAMRVLADGVPAALLRATFVYGAAGPSAGSPGT